MNHERGEEGPQSMCWRDAIAKLTQEQYIEHLHKRIEELEEAVERYRGF